MLRGLLVCVVCLAGVACGSDAETLFSANFDTQPLGTPELKQQVGKLVPGLFGRLEVVRSPEPGGQDAGNWVQIIQTQDGAPRTRLRGAFARFAGDGRYLATAILFIPEGMSARLAFEERFANPVSPFLEIEFPRSGRMFRPSPSPISWGRFPHGRRFRVAVNLNVFASGTTATITLLHPAEGSLDLVLSPAASAVARQFGQISLATGEARAGSTFFAKVLGVTYNAPPPQDDVIQP